MGVRRDTVFDNGSGSKSNPRGFEIDLRLPIFDWGGMRRDAMTGQTLAAANQLEAVTRAAGSHLRESYSAYRTAYDIARHFRDEVVPLRRFINNELLLRYIEAQVYQAVAENMASEQSARMVAMKAATDNAGSVIGELKLVYNKTRQAGITKELSEIVAGAAAV